MNLLWNLSPGVLALPFLRLSYYSLLFVPLVLSDLICSTSNPEQCGKQSVLTYIGGYKRLKDGWSNLGMVCWWFVTCAYALLSQAGSQTGHLGNTLTLSVSTSFFWMGFWLPEIRSVVNTSSRYFHVVFHNIKYNSFNPCGFVFSKLYLKKAVANKRLKG